MDAAADFEALAATYQTPFYLYEMDAALAHLRALRQALDPRIETWYCVKANGNRRLLELFRQQTPWLDISSAGELRLALAAGYRAADLSFAGPGKSLQELDAAIEAGVRVISVESLGELASLDALCQAKGRRQAVTLRINPESVPGAFMMKMGGRPSPFGIPEEEALEALEQAQACAGIEVVGLHIFAGTQCLELEALIDNVEQTLAIAARLAGQTALSLQLVNLGGGFGVPYFEDQEPLDLQQLATRLNGAVRQAAQTQPALAQVRCALELGRFLIAPYGSYVTRVIDIKDCRGKRFVVLDGGMHHCFAATGNFGQLIKKNYPVENLSRPTAAPERVELVGPLCTPLDSMARNIALPSPRTGDLLAFRHTGAYGFSASPLLFLGHETPAELIRHAGQVELARPRRSTHEL